MCNDKRRPSDPGSTPKRTLELSRLFTQTLRLPPGMRARQSLKRLHLRPSDSQAGDHYGFSSATDAAGNTLIVGAHMAQTPQGQTGAAYILTRSADGWLESAKLVAPDGKPGDMFGFSVALSHDGLSALVSAPQASQRALCGGAVYSFRRQGETWQHEATLFSCGAAAGGKWFGWRLALNDDGSVALIGSSARDLHCGYAAIYHRGDGSWYRAAELAPHCAPPELIYALALSEDGEQAVIGSPLGRRRQGEGSGALYVFRATGKLWEQEARLVTSDNSGEFGFALSLSADGSTILSGSTGGGNYPKKLGPAYLFRRGNGRWESLAQLLPHDRQEGDFFGYSVALDKSGKSALIGSLADKAYLFQQDGRHWQQSVRLEPAQKGNSNRFGRSVSLSADGSTLLIGAYQESLENRSQAGAAYVFTPA